MKSSAIMQWTDTYCWELSWCNNGRKYSYYYANEQDVVTAAISVKQIFADYAEVWAKESVKIAFICRIGNLPVGDEVKIENRIMFKTNYLHKTGDLFACPETGITELLDKSRVVRKSGGSDTWELY